MFTSAFVPPTAVATAHHVDPNGEHGPSSSGKMAYIAVHPRGTKTTESLSRETYEGSNVSLKMERIEGDDGYVSTGYYDSMRNGQNVGGSHDANSSLADLSPFGEDGEETVVPDQGRERAGISVEPVGGVVMRSSMRQSSSLKDLVAYEQKKAEHYKRRKPSRHSTAPLSLQSPEVVLPALSASAPATPQPDNGEVHW